jgi:phosphoribosylanthranilate isomerase
MSLWVKICGNTSLEDALVAADAGADAVGFVFAPSPRRVTVEQVAAITPGLPESLEKIGVFADTGFDTICAAVEAGGLTGVQLHSSVEVGNEARLRKRFEAGLRILRVIHFGRDAAEHLRNLPEEIDAVLVDSRTATAIGGTGIAFDWKQAREAIFRPESGLKLVAAGGLSPANVAEAIRTLRPWGVDVVTGVETAPGVKDAGKVREFVANARANSGFGGATLV